VEWLWPGRLALGKLALLDGDPGVGKSLIALDLCARLSNGHPWPDGSPSPGAWPSLVVQAEDNPRDTLRPRLQALGADLARVFYPDGNDPLAAGPLRLPSGAAALDGAIARTGARLVVLDPLTACFDPGVCTSYEPSIRAALEPLAGVAEVRRCGFLFVRHLNKRCGARALYRGGGHIALLASCRSAWLVAADPDAPGDPAKPARRVVAQLKNNLAVPQPSLAFEVRTAAGAPPTLTWLGPCPLTADDLLARRPGRPAAALEEAQGFLAAALADGPLTSDELWARAREQGVSERTLYRAREPLEVSIIRRFQDRRPVVYWLLPHQKLPADASGDLELDELDESLRRLTAECRARRNPLDNPGARD
jgi:hypothetical protein